MKIGARVVYRAEVVEAFEAQQTRASTSDIPAAAAAFFSLANAAEATVLIARVQK